MCIYLDLDEDSYCFTWEKVEHSEDYCAASELGYCSEEEEEDEEYDTCRAANDDDDDDWYEDMVRYLQQISPHIRWRITVNGSDEYGASPSLWRIICVPEDQFQEAEYVFDRFLEGDNLDDYSYTDRFPEIYKKVPGEPSKLRNETARLYELLLQYETLMLCADEIDAESFFKTLNAVLPQIYHLGQLLPHVLKGSYNETCYCYKHFHSENILPYEKFFCIKDPFSRDKEVESVLLSEILQGIYQEVQPGLEAFSEGHPELIAATVNSWRISFSIGIGVSRDILTALLAIQQIRCKMS